MTLRGALIGCGFFAENHLNSWRELDVDLSAVCDLDASKSAATAAKHGVAHSYSDAAVMLDAEEPDFVDIATTVSSHRALVELAAQRGIAVICQKPLAIDLMEADSMIAACASAGVPFMVHENFRWQAPMIAVKEAIESGAIGKPFFGRISFRHDFDVYALQPYLAQVDRMVILDLGIHLIDLARAFFGEVRSLSCVTQSVNPKVRGEDVATIVLEHLNGATCVVDASFYTHDEPNPFPQTTIEIDGSDGVIKIPPGYKMSVATRGRKTVRDVEPQLRPWMVKPWHVVQDSVLNIQRHWLEHLEMQRPLLTSGEDNRRTLEVCLAAYESAASGRVVSIGGAATPTA